jgi:hypothetical protein
MDAGPETPKDHDMTAIADYLHLKPAKDMTLIDLSLCANMLSLSSTPLTVPFQTR